MMIGGQECHGDIYMIMCTLKCLTYIVIAYGGLKYMAKTIIEMTSRT